MKYFFILFSAILVSCSTTTSTEAKSQKTTEDAYGTDKFELPKTWDKDFSISLYEGGGMRNESENILFSADSCKYVHSVDNIDTTKRFTLTPQEKEEILAKARTFNVGTIETVKTEITYDKETSSLCFSQRQKPSYCLETGAASEIKEKDRANFGNMYSYLWTLATTKGRSGKISIGK